MSKANTLQENILYIDRLSKKGRAVSSDNKWEVIGALPGEEVLVEFGGRRKKRRQGFLRQVIRSAPERTTPKCSHVPDCGGCAFQQMDYKSQLEYKQRLVQEIFTPLIADHSPEIRSILGCETPWNYRNKMEFSFSQNRAGEKFLGLMLAHGKGRVLNLSECHLVSAWFTQVLHATRSWWQKRELCAYHHRSDTGHLRTLTVREAKQGRGKMVMLTVSGNPDYALKKSHIDSFISTIKEITQDEHLSIFLQVQQIAKGRPTQFFEMHLFGPDHITEILNVNIGKKTHQMEFKISPTSFFQPNTLQTEKIYSEGIKMLSNLEKARVFDLYCGGGTIGLSVAKVAKEVVGIELNHHCVFDAGWNQEVNGVKNFSIFRGDVSEVLTHLKREKDFSPPDAIIIDPPRAGLDENALDRLKELSAQEILYISCNPKTQAENIEQLAEAGYRLKIIQPIDQFPHTVHLENICLLQRA